MKTITVKEMEELQNAIDNFAIGFGTWLTKKGNYNINNWNKSMEEMLDVYKKEIYKKEILK